MNAEHTDYPVSVIYILDDKDPDAVVINRGSSGGIKVGDRFIVYGLGPELFDPSTGESLGRLEIVRGRGVAVHVQEFMTTIKSTEKQTERLASKKIIKEQGLAYFGPKTIEEIVPESIENLPFKSPKVGDRARQI